MGQVLKSGTTFFKKWGNNYKVMQYRRQMRETGESNSPNTLRLGILEKLKFCHNEKKKETTSPPQTYLRDL